MVKQKTTNEIANLIQQILGRVCKSKNCKTHIEEVSIDVVRPRYTVNRVQKYSGVVIYRARVLCYVLTVNREQKQQQTSESRQERL